MLPRSCREVGLDLCTWCGSLTQKRSLVERSPIVQRGGTVPWRSLVDLLKQRLGGPIRLPRSEVTAMGLVVQKSGHRPQAGCSPHRARGREVPARCRWPTPGGLELGHQVCRLLICPAAIKSVRSAVISSTDVLTGSRPPNRCCGDAMR